VTAAEVWAIDPLHPAEGLVRFDRLDATADPTHPVASPQGQAPAPGAPGPLLPWLVTQETTG